MKSMKLKIQKAKMTVNSSTLLNYSFNVKRFKILLLDFIEVTYEEKATPPKSVPTKQSGLRIAEIIG